MNLNGFYTVIAMLFLLMAIGFAARKLNIIDEFATKRFSKLIICIGQPCMLMNAFVNYEYSTEGFLSGFSMLGLGFLLHAFIAAVSFFACKIYKFKEFDEQKLSEFAMIFANCGFLGFPLMEALYGAEGLFLAAFFNISFQVFIWTWGLSIIARKRDDIKISVRKIFINYGTVPCAIGVGLYALSSLFSIPDFISTTLSSLASICTPISVLITGALLATRTLKQIIADLQIYYLSAFKLIIIPTLVCLITHLCGLDEKNVIFLAIMAALPSASTVTMMAELYDVRPGYASQAVGTTSLLSIATMPLIIQIADLIMKI